MASEFMQCWKDRWEERRVVLTVGALMLAFFVGAAVLVADYSAPPLLAAVVR